MILRHFFIVLTACSGIAVAAATAANEMTVNIVDKTGQPLANAVLMIDDGLLTEAARSDASAHIIDQVDRQFTPFMTAVKTGSTITFPNSDNIRHHVYSFSQPKPFELKLYADGERPSLRFEQPGLVTLGCNIHDQMIAHIVISDRRTAFVSDPRGNITLSLAQSAASSVSATLWHPWQGADLSHARSVQLNPTEQQTLQLEVTAPAPPEPPKSRLQQRFNRTGNQ